MLYWAEGSRRNKHVIQLCLTIQLFKAFDKEKTRRYWSGELGISEEFISVNIHSDQRSKPSHQWSSYGIVRIEVRNVKLKKWLDESLEKYLVKWNSIH